MKVFWTEEAKIELKQTLMYWTIHNMSDSYSKKIDVETTKLIEEITVSPYFLASKIRKLTYITKTFLPQKQPIYPKNIYLCTLFKYYNNFSLFSIPFSLKNETFLF